MLIFMSVLFAVIFLVPVLLVMLVRRKGFNKKVLAITAGVGLLMGGSLYIGSGGDEAFQESIEQQEQEAAEKKAEEKAKAEAEEKAKKEAEAEAKAKAEQEAKAKKEAEEKAEVEAKAKKEAEEAEKAQLQKMLIHEIETELIVTFIDTAEVKYEESEKTFYFYPYEEEILFTALLGEPVWKELIVAMSEFGKVVESKLGTGYTLAMQNPKAPELSLVIVTDGLILYDVSTE